MFFNLMQIIPKAMGPQIAALLGLIAMQFVFAVAIAIRDKKFEWIKLADFYRTRVVPYLLGWAAFTIGAAFASHDILGPEYGQLVGDGVSWGAWLLVVSTMGAKIVESLNSLYGKHGGPIDFPSDNQSP